MDISRIRNFALVAHIDHGKSTLADRLMERAGLLPTTKAETPRIDSMELETERGVTIKLKAVRLPCTLSAKTYTLNMLDTPGHVDFSYEVSRSLAACEGVLLLVDATQGIQAQTLSHLEKARELELAVVGVINKIDAPAARVQEVEEEMKQLGIRGEILKISALEGWGIEGVFGAVVERIPAPRGEPVEPFKALVFDSTFDPHLGTIAYVRVVDGNLENREQRSENRVKFLGTRAQADVKELGFFAPERKSAESISAGEVGYIATGLRDPQGVRVGDTVVLVSQLSSFPVTQLPGYRPPQSYVFASFFARNARFDEFKRALETLYLEEPSITVSEVSTAVFGRGFRIGFLGTFHLEIVGERLKREFGLDLIVTKPTVNLTSLDQEPWIKAEILTPPEYLSGVTKLVNAYRGILGETATLGSRLKVAVELPLMEFIRGFYDALKGISQGYASLSWEFLENRLAELVELKILVHGGEAEGLSEVVTKDQALRMGREKLKKLKKILPRKQFAYAVQAKVGGKIIAREDIPALRKDVTAPLYGGDVTRKRKLLEKQKKGKKRLGRQGQVEVPPEAFLV